MSGQKIGVLLADCNHQLCKTIASCLRKEKDIELLGIAYDGWLALEQVKQYQPDVLVLEILIPGLDGIGVMEKLSKVSKKPKVIVITAFNKKQVINKLIKMGTSYYMVKPVDFEILLRVIRKFGREKMGKDLIEENSEGTFDADRDLEFEVSKLFHNLGIPVHLRGYSYLREAVILALQDEKILGNLVKHLYPKIAMKYCITVASIESAIRHTIVTSWERGNREYFKEIFDHKKILPEGEKPPTIAEFIGKVVELLRFKIL